MESIKYVIRMGKVVGYDPDGFPSREICIYFSWKAVYGDKLAIKPTVGPKLALTRSKSPLEIMFKFPYLA